MIKVRSLDVFQLFPTNSDSSFTVSWCPTFPTVCMASAQLNELTDLTNDCDVAREGCASASGQASQAGSNSKEGRTSSDVYKFVEQNSDNMFYCSCCKKQNKATSWKTRSTSNFRNHLQKFHPEEYCSVDPKQSSLHQFGFHSTPKKRKPDRHDDFTVSDQKMADESLTKWIVHNVQPFSVVEHEDFVSFCSYLRPDYQVPTRNTVRNRILKLWEVEKAQVRLRLKSEIINCRVGITTDMRTSAAKRGYMVVTLHYIDAGWTMRSVIIAFVRVLYLHSAERLGDHLIKAIIDMDGSLLGFLWAITADNASTNPAMVNYLQPQLETAIREHVVETINKIFF